MVARSVRYASEFMNSGYAVAARRCLNAMIEAGVEVAWEPLHDVPHLGRVRAPVAESAPAWLRARRSFVRPGENLVLHAVPKTWKLLISEMAPAHVIGHTVWEAERLSANWLDQMSCVNEFWVPTHWNKDLFASSFKKPVHVVPHVAATDDPEECPISIPSDRFTFVCVSAWDWRKRPDRVVEAYLNAFTADDNVQLVVKTTRSIVGWDSHSGDPVTQVKRIASRYPRPASIIINTGHWTDGQMLGLLGHADCFVSMSASEGWGLGAFDAACMGVPVLITGWGGQVEWLGSSYPGLIPFSMVEADHPDRDVFEPGIYWSYPDMSAMVDKLREVAGGSAHNLTTTARNLAPQLRERYSVESVGRSIIDALSSLEDRPVGFRPGSVRPANEDGSLLILTPVKNAARFAAGYVDRILGLTRPAGGISVAILVSDSDDDSAHRFDSEFDRLRTAGIDARVFTRDFGYRIPEGVARWEPSIQLDRRRVLALSRNHLLFSALRDEDWVMWIDADVISYPPDLFQQLVSTGADIVQPDCVREVDGPSFDLNAWTDRGRWHLHDYRGYGPIDLHAVGGTVLLVRADRHRDGLVWPAYLYGNDNPRKRTDPARIAREGIGEIETEGLAMMAYDMGIACVGVPGIQVIHQW